MECGVWCVECGVWSVGVECGVWCVVCGVWSVVCGVWCVECGVWSVVCVVCGVVCGVSRKEDTSNHVSCADVCGVCMYVEKGRNLKSCVVTTVNFLHCCKARKCEAWNHRSAYTWLADGRMMFDKGRRKGSVVGDLCRFDTWSANEQS